MGLRYEIFAVNVPVEKFKESMLITGAIDETEGMLLKRKEEAIESEIFEKLNKDNVDEILQDMQNVRSKNTEEYENRTKDQLQILIMAIPDCADWTIGWYYHLDLLFDKQLNHIPTKILLFYLNTFSKATSDVYFMTFSSVCDDGDVYKYSINEKNIALHEYKHQQNENENYEKYVTRLQCEYKIPTLAIYRYYRSVICELDWQYHLRWDILKKKQDREKK